MAGVFDKILVDAPCSGEGMFRREEDMVKDWVSRGPSYYSSIQREILRAGCGHVKTRRNDALFYLYLLKKKKMRKMWRIF